ncbi:amidase [Aliishimia ponticola]|nr:amidase [Aliishimia ponticola]
MDDLLLGSVEQLSQAIMSKKVSVSEVLEATFARVDRINPDVNAVIWQDRDAARREAAACDADIAAGKFRGPLHGIPVTVKESFDLTGAPSTWGVPEWANNIASEDSDAVARYRAAGAIVYGKTNVPLKLIEWQSFNEIYGSTSNPWDVTRTPGGSSGGSAVSLATGMAALEAGSDIGSSIRNPAHYNGVFGLKPTWNAVSTWGHTPRGQYGSKDIAVAGPLARSAGDLALAYGILSGADRFTADAWQLRHLGDKRQKLSEFRVALLLGDSASPVDENYLNLLEDFADELEEAGASVARADWPDVDSEAHFTLYLRLLGAAMSFGLSDAQVQEQMDMLKDAPEDIRRIQGNRFAGMTLSHREWLALDNARLQARMRFDAFFENYDVILTPVAASAAFKKDEVGPRWQRRIPINGHQQLENQQLFWSGYSGVVGLPSVVGPMDKLDGLPVGYQAICGYGRDMTALAFARAVEREIVGYTPPPIALSEPDKIKF